MWIPSLCIVFVACVHSISCKCIYEHYSQEFPPVFTQRFEEQDIILKPLSQKLYISEGKSLKAYCDSNFSVPIFDESESEGIASVDIKCSKGVLSYENDDEDKSVKVETREKLSCYGSQPELYAGYSCGGSAKSLLYGLTVQQKQVVLSTFCYNFNTMDVMYISYTSSDSSVLQDTRSRNADLTPERKVAVNFIESNEFRTKELNSHFLLKLDSLEKLDLFRFDYLVPIERLTKSYPYQLDLLEGPNSIPWWINLKEGNWKRFEKLLASQLITGDYDVHTGIAYNHEIQEEIRRREYQPPRSTPPPANPYYEPRNASRRTYEQPYVYDRVRQMWVKNPAKRSIPNDIAYGDDIKYMSGSIVKTIPLFVWTYVKPMSDSEGVVIIAVNSPFIEASAYQRLEFCKGRFPDWLRDLEDSARIPSLGYMFACSSDQVRPLIRVFPQ